MARAWPSPNRIPHQHAQICAPSQEEAAELLNVSMTLERRHLDASQRGSTSTALAGSIASAMRLLVKAILAGTSDKFIRGSHDTDTMLGHLESGRGLGRDIIEGFLHGVPGINSGSVKQQLANLKASGLIGDDMAVSPW